MNLFHKKYDLMLTILLLTLIFLGPLILYAASSVLASRWTGQADYYFWKQLVWMGLGFLGMIFLAAAPKQILEQISVPAAFFSILLLTLVFVPGIGHSVSSSRDAFSRWIRIGGLTFQPSEFAKLAIVLYLARLFGKNREPLFLDYRKSVLPLSIVFFKIILILLEPQYGTSLSLLAVLVLLIYLSGYPALRLGIFFASTIPLLLLLIFFWEYRLERVSVWLDPWAHRYSGGYQLVTSFRAFATGGFLGTKIASGFAHTYLTYGHTDFVFALFAEDFGLLGICLLFCLYLSLLWRGWMLLAKSQEHFSYLLGTASLMMLFLQTLLNLFVVTGLLPTTGVSLPFISYGGSSLLTSMCLAGLLLNATKTESN